MDKKQQIVDLWRTCFGDSEAFISLYFDRVYRDENTLTLERDGRIVSALQMLPYTMTYLGTEIQVAYICGACTAPGYRGQGWMRQLLLEAFEVMRRRDVTLTALIPADPWLFDYYRVQGYTEAFDYTEETYIRPDLPVQRPDVLVVEPEVPSTEALYAYFDRKLRERPACVLHAYDDFITLLRDLALTDGRMYTALDGNEQVSGMAFVQPLEDHPSPAGKKLLVKELLYDTDEIRQLLLQEVTLQNGVLQATVKTPPSPPGTYPLGMARVIDTDRMIHLWLSRHKDSPLSRKELEEMDIQTLTRKLLDYPERTGYMSLMLD